MKKSLYAVISFVIVMLSACSTLKDPTGLVQITVDENIPQAVFSADEIKTALENRGYKIIPVDSEWTIEFTGIDERLGEQAYRVSVSSNGHISIIGGDSTGLMYGGLEVAEQIKLSGGLEGVRETSGTPNIKNRGVKFNIPLDMRTPSYSDAGNTGQQNIPEMWSLDFWHEQLDEMARYRFNMLSIWNLNPFPSMVNVPEYPDTALDNVWRTTLDFDDSYNGTATNMVRPEHWENYEVVKEITIEEKIDFWREVMRYAHERGIDFYIFTWNIYTYAENGKYGITPDIENKTTIDYFRASVRELVKTYPDLDGIGITAGEQMQWAPGTEELNEQWLYDTYGQGVKDALSETADRDFTMIHRLHLAEFDMIQDIWDNFPGEIEFSDKYALEHMYSFVRPTFVNETLDSLPEHKLLWLELRNNDIYNYRWGDPEFAREYIRNMPPESQLAGFNMGADAYVPGREVTSLEPEVPRQLTIRKQWFNYMLWGRLGYDPSLTDTFFSKVMVEHFPESDGEKLAEAMSIAGKIIPQISRLYFQSSDSAWFPEACVSHPYMFGFLDIMRWMKSDNAMKDAGVMSIVEYVQSVIDEDTETDLQTPPEVAAALVEYAERTLSLVEEIRANAPSKTKTNTQKEFDKTLGDQEAMALMGLYYSEKILGAVDLRLYNDTKSAFYQSNAVEHLEKALVYWNQYAQVATGKYNPQRYPRLGYVDLNALTENVEKDVAIARRWKPKKL